MSAPAAAPRRDVDLVGGARTVLWQLAAVTRRDVIVEASYRFRMVLVFTTAAASAFLAFFVSKLVGDTPLLAQYDGDYFDYVVVGIGLSSYAGLAVSAFNQRIMREQQAGTLEVLLAGPATVGTLLAGGFVVPLVLTTVEVAMLVGIGIGALGAGVSATGLVVAVPVVLLTIANFSALGVASAALVVLVKRGDPISGPLAQLTLVLSGAIFPVELLPGWLVTVARLTPGYYGVRGLREALLTEGGWSGVGDEVAILAGMAAVLLPLSLALFARTIRTAKRLGVLASY